MNPNDIFPLTDKPSDKVIEHQKTMSKKEHRSFKKSDTYKKYVQPTIDREKKVKKEERKSWLWDRGLVLLNTILALIAAVTGIISILK